MAGILIRTLPSSTWRYGEIDLINVTFLLLVYHIFSNKIIFTLFELAIIILLGKG